MTGPIGADAVIPSRPSRLARLRLGARPGVELRGRVHVERGVRITVAAPARVIVEDGAMLCAGCRIEAAGGTVRVGPGSRIGARAVLVSQAGIDVGADCVVGEWAIVSDAEHAEPVAIGEGARIGAHAKILATVPAKALVASYETRSPRPPS